MTRMPSSAAFAALDPAQITQGADGTRRAPIMLVERRGWLTATEFADLLGLCQFLPGGNVVNLSVAVGMEFRGLRGAFRRPLVGTPVSTTPGAGHARNTPPRLRIVGRLNVGWARWDRS